MYGMAGTLRMKKKRKCGFRGENMRILNLERCRKLGMMLLILGRVLLTYCCLLSLAGFLFSCSSFMI